MPSMLLRTGLLCGLFLPALFLAPALAQEDTDHPERGKWCYRCHGETGTASNLRTPNLAGQKALYLATQLARYQQGSSLGGTDADDASTVLRVHRSMGFNAKRLSPENISTIARYYASQKCQNPPQPAKFTGPLPAAMKLCTQCHGVNGISDNDNIPNLAAQNYRYLVNQLNIFKKPIASSRQSETRDWRHHPLMGKLAQSLSGDEVQAVAGYFAALSCDAVPLPYKAPPSRTAKFPQLRSFQSE